VPELAHFVIENGSIRGYNGALALGAKINLDLNCKPKAIPFFKAISNCQDTIQMALTGAGKLSIKSGKFKAIIECLDEETMNIQPDGDVYEIDGAALLKALKIVVNLIGVDASRPWCEGVLLKEGSLFVTNNVILVEHWLGFIAPHPVNIPKIAIKELLRIGDAPVKCLVSNSTISFLYADDRWIRSQLLDVNWPNVSALLGGEANLELVDKTIFDGLEVVAHFADKANRIFFNHNVISTCQDASLGAEYEIDSVVPESVFNIDMFKLLKNVATKIDLSAYPKPCPFVGENLRGVIVGLKLI